MTNFCPQGETFATVFDKSNGGFSQCAANIIFPVLLLALALTRLLIIRPWKAKRAPLQFGNPALAKHESSGNSETSQNGLPRNGKANETPGKRLASIAETENDVETYEEFSTSITDNQPLINLRRASKFPLLQKIFMWLNFCYPINYGILMTVNVSLNGGFAWEWPIFVILMKAAWVLLTYDLKSEVSAALERSNKPVHSHNFLLITFWLASFGYELIPLINMTVTSWHYNWEERFDKFAIILLSIRIVYLLVILSIAFYAPGLPAKPRNRSSDSGNFSYSQRNSENIAGRLTTDDQSTFRNMIKKFKFLWPYVWPKDEPLSQLYVILCFVILVLGRVANVFIPVFYSKVVNALSNKDLTQIPVSYILAYSAFYCLTGSGLGGSGLLSNARSFMWIRVSQYTMRKTMVDIFAHLHSLSLRWHLGRKTGEVLGVIDRGNNSVNTLLNYILFTILPTFADIFIAIGYFVFAFNIYFGLMVFACMALYIGATVLISEWRTKYKRETNKLDNQTRTKAVDSLLNFETVKYYGAEVYEVNRYRTSLLGYQREQWKFQASMQLLNFVQVIIVNLGLLGGCLLCAYYIVYEGEPVGTFVLYSTYMLQLYGPLNFLGIWYRMIQQSFIDMENMLDLFMEPREVTDAENCTELTLRGGEVEFKNVSFHYTAEKPILKNVSFKVPAGSTVAVVGPSGSGKSTLIRLLFRFYDIQGGAITIDGQDISQVSQNSLRKNIGVVPQDTVLFNDTIKYNIQYGRPTANDSEVIESAERADIHERIRDFPLGYDTVVGERGLKLSGGEKQRVAIARTVLKAPRMVLLDEATSALDTQTERHIQSALNDVIKYRTTLVVAHRLSTVVDADMILVLKDGVIVERGTHHELLSQSESVYCDMWNQQITAVQNGTNGSSGDEKSMDSTESETRRDTLVAKESVEE